MKTTRDRLMGSALFVAIGLLGIAMVHEVDGFGDPHVIVAIAFLVGLILWCVVAEWSDRLNTWSNRKGVPIYSTSVVLLAMLVITVWMNTRGW